MNSAQDHLLAGAAIPVGDLVGAAGLDGHGGDAHQIDVGVVEANRVTQMLLHHGNVMFGRGDRRQELKRGAFDLSSTQAHARVRIRVDESNSHVALAAVSRR